MSSLMIADAPLAARLEKADGPVEICSADGTRLGFFTPAKPAKYQLEPKISEEELQRRENDTTCEMYSAAEVEAKLREWQCTR